MKNKNLLLVGHISGNTGYNIHTRNFYKAVGKQFNSTELDLSKGTDAIKKELFNYLGKYGNSQNNVTIMISYGRYFTFFNNLPGFNIGYTTFGSTIIPKEWLEPLKIPNKIWTTTGWNKQILIENGFKAKQIDVVPEGVNTEIFNPNKNSIPALDQIPGFKFLNIGKWEKRKCTKELIIAFDQEFHSEKDVYLVLSVNNTFMKNFSVSEEINKLSLKSPEKILVLNSISNDIIVSLYNSCDAFLFPSRSEGWGLPITEAMACGLPVVATNYSGPTEFITEENCYLLDYQLEDIKDLYFNWTDFGTGKWAQPDMEQLKFYMRYIYENRDEAIKKGKFARQQMVEKWNWQNAANIALKLIAQYE